MMKAVKWCVLWCYSEWDDISPLCSRVKFRWTRKVKTSIGKGCQSGRSGSGKIKWRWKRTAVPLGCLETTSVRNNQHRLNCIVTSLQSWPAVNHSVVVDFQAHCRICKRGGKISAKVVERVIRECSCVNWSRPYSFWNMSYINYSTSNLYSIIYSDHSQSRWTHSCSHNCQLEGLGE